MEIYENENDQVEAVKRFFAENGKALAVGVILGVGALIGWRYWNSHQVDSARSASLAYQNAVTATYIHPHGYIERFFIFIHLLMHYIQSYKLPLFILIQHHLCN